jgi:hypothetical protein
MHRSTAFLGTAALLLLVACTRTIVVRPAPESDRGDRGGSRPPPRNYPPPPEPEQPPPPADRPTSVTLGIPPGHLPDPGECRVWIPGTPPGRQPRPRSRPCQGIAAYAPAGSWIVYRPTDDRRVVHVRVVDERRAGWVIRVRIFDIATERLLREEEPGDEDGRRPPDNRPPPREEPPPPPPPPPPSTATRLGVPPGQLPDPGQCRVWIPVAPARMQPYPRSRPCAGILADAPARSWIIYRPLDDRRVVHVRIVDERRVVIRIRVFDITTEQLLREEEPRGDVVERPSVDTTADTTRGRRPVPRPEIQPPIIQPPVERPPEQRPPVQPPVQPPPEQRPPVQPPADNRPPPAAGKLDVPPGHLPEVGECRIWFPGRPPGQQPRPKSRPCAGIAAAAPAGSWIIYRPSDDKKVVHVRIVDERRGGVVVRIRIYDIETEQLVREENP